MIKIISGYSHAAGSTLALVNFCNQLTSNGHACTLYGPDNWHIDKCSSGMLSEFSAEAGDTVIVSNVPVWSVGDLSDINALLKANVEGRLLKSLGRIVTRFLPSKAPSSYKLIMTRLNNDALRPSFVRSSPFHKLHFASYELAKDFRESRPYFVAPSFCKDLKQSGCKPKKTAGVIGSIKKRNNTVKAIEQALLDGMETVILFGYMEDPIYFYKEIEPLTIKHPGRIKYAGFIDERQKIYDSLSDVYSAVSKSWSVVGHECAMTNTKFHAPHIQSDVGRMTNDEIFGIWKNELAL